MKKLVYVFLSLLTSVLIVGCNKSGGDCLSSTGKIIFQDRGHADFDSIEMNGYVNLILTQDSINSITVEAGEKIISGISTEVKNRQLILRNLNSCNWTRDYGKPINVHVKVRNLELIDYNSSGNISATNTITSQKFRVDVRDGCGTVDLDVKNEIGEFIERAGTVDFEISGSITFCYIYAADYGPFHCENLATGYQYVTNKGSNDCYVRCQQELSVNINSIGNVYYTGNPLTIIQSITGSGKLIPF